MRLRTLGLGGMSPWPFLLSYCFVFGCASLFVSFFLVVDKTKLWGCSVLLHTLSCLGASVDHRLNWIGVFLTSKRGEVMASSSVRDSGVVVVIGGAFRFSGSGFEEE